MTSNSQPHDAAAGDQPEASWEQLKQKIESAAGVGSLDDWIATQLQELEEAHATMVTARSRARCEALESLDR